jgi:hypothetical protein
MYGLKAVKKVLMCPHHLIEFVKQLCESMLGSEVLDI